MSSSRPPGSEEVLVPLPDSTDRRSPPAVLMISTILLVAGVATVYTLSFSSRSNACSSSVPAPSARSPIQHVFFLIKENHAFENYFGDRPGVVGYPPNGSLPLAPGSNATVHPFALAGASTADLPHDHASDVVDRDGGRNDLFVAEASSEGYPNPSDAVGYYTSGQLPDYYAYARNYTLGDMFFTGVLGPTLPNRLFDLGLTNLTWNSDLPPPASDVRGPTLPGQFAAAGLAWDYFHLGGTTGLPTSYATQIAGNPCLSSHVLPISDLKSVLAGPDPPAMAYIDPENGMQYSEHPPANVTVGDEWTVSVVDAIFESPIGNSSAIFFFYDENGGFWDPVPPPSVLPQGDGFRVPLLVLSAWTPPDAVSHQLLDPSNLMRWTESNWGLGPLTPRLANATLPAGLFNFSRPARPPVVLPTPISLPELAEPSPTAPPHSSGLVPNPSVGPPPARTPSKAPLPTSGPASASYRAAAWVEAGARECHRFARGPSREPRELPGRLFRGTRPTSQRTPAPARFVESRHGRWREGSLARRPRCPPGPARYE